jgi:hypothetical protein
LPTKRPLFLNKPCDCKCQAFAARRETLHEHTAVNVDLLAGDVIAVRHKEEHRFGDNLGVSEATDWDLAHDFCLHCRRHGADHVGFSIAGRYDVDRNAGIGQLEGGRPGKAMSPPLLAL